jgi:N-acetylglucosamine-6-phosphate deacetylase
VSRSGAAEQGTALLGVEGVVSDGRLVNGDVQVDRSTGRIEAISVHTTVSTGLVAIPLFIDLQVNGFAGIDVLSTDVDGLLQLSSALQGTGVGAWMPTCITADPEVTISALSVIASAKRTDSSILGAHLEGPFLSPGKLGAHPARFRRDPDVALLERYLAAGPVSMVTLAPELTGADTLIDRLVRANIIVSAGHTMADALEAEVAFNAGVACVTHLGNAMVPVTARAPGLMAVALTDPRVSLGMIVDGVHLSDAFVRLAMTAAPSRVMLVSDAIAPAGQPDGTYEFGPISVTVANGEARLSQGTLAGSVATVAAGFARLIALGFDVESATWATSGSAARLIGQPERVRLQPGDPASMLVVEAATGTLMRILHHGVELPVRG